MTLSFFKDKLTSEKALQELVGQPSEIATRKQLSALDDHCRIFLTHSPFALIGTFDETGNCDVSPRGDAPGFALVLDDKTLVIPERPGNRRVDTLRNILQTSRIGLLFLVPNMEETLRINGLACIVRDNDILERCTAFGKRPLLAIGIEIEECFMQCGKALKRSKLWDATTWPKRTNLPTMAQMMLDQAQPKDKTLQDIEAHLKESFATRYY